MTPAEAQKMIRDNVCARCYGDLVIYHERQEGKIENVAKCPHCGDAWNGATLRRKTAERMGQRAAVEVQEIKANMPDLFPSPHAGKGAKKILSELGF